MTGAEQVFIAAVLGSEVDRVGQDVAWHGVESHPARDADETKALLAGPLTADRAVRLAVLHNHDLQASFEELGIARARLVRAVALPNPELDPESVVLAGARALGMSYGQMASRIAEFASERMPS